MSIRDYAAEMMQLATIASISGPLSASAAESSIQKVKRTPELGGRPLMHLKEQHELDLAKITPVFPVQLFEQRANLDVRTHLKQREQLESDATIREDASLMLLRETAQRDNKR